MSGEEEHLSREELVEREHQASCRENEELQRRIEELCREAGEYDFVLIDLIS